MPIEFELPHAQARAYLHTGRRALPGGAAKQLEAHLAGCPACRAYADYLAQAEPALTAALRAQWDPAQPPQSERAFAAAVRARLARPQRALPNWFSSASVTLTVGAALLVLVVVWLTAGWGMSTGGPQPTEIVVESFPLPEVTAEPLGLPSPTPATESPLPADLLDRWVAFVTRTTGQHDEVYVMRTDGHDGQRLTGLPATLGYDHSLSWSPDGTRLAFVSDRSGHPEVYVAEAGVWAAHQLTELTLLPGETTPTDYDLSWSPNGQLLAVTVYGARAPMDNWIGGDAYLISVELERQPFPTQAPRLARGLLNAAIWSPDGTRLAYVGYDDQTLPAVFIVEVPAEAIATHPVLNLNVQQITPSAAASDAPHDIYLGFAWSPDSTQLAYLRQGPWIGSPLDVSGVQTGEGFHSSIEVLNLAHPAGGSASIPPTGLFDLSSPNGIMGLSWSPDGQYLLYLSDAVTAASLGNGTASTGCWTPRLLPVAGGPAVALDGVCYLTRTALPQWSPDSRYLLFSAEAGLVTVNVPQALANGGHAQPLFLPVPTDLPGLAHSPTWQPVP